MLKGILCNISLWFNNLSAFAKSTIESIVYLSGGSLVDSDTLLTEGNIKNFGQLATGLQRIMQDIVGPIMIVIGALLAIFMIKMGVDYAKAESADKRKECMGRLVGIGIGLLIVLVGITLCYSINWVETYAIATGHTHKFLDNNSDTFCDYCAQKTDSVIHK